VVKYKVDGVKLAWVEKDGQKMFKVNYTRPYGATWMLHTHARDELEAYTKACKQLGAS
jgi:hypothetical protein